MLQLCELGTLPIADDAREFFLYRKRLILRSVDAPHRRCTFQHIEPETASLENVDILLTCLCSYLTNIAAYLYLRAHGPVLRSHPVIERLLVLRKVCADTREPYIACLIMTIHTLAP